MKPNNESFVSFAQRCRNVALVDGILEITHYSSFPLAELKEKLTNKVEGKCLHSPLYSSLISLLLIQFDGFTSVAILKRLHKQVISKLNCPPSLSE